ncbi:2-octaprenyl-6-methoxyphenol hydroxylase/2-octaprenyl-3-methyl-6-methoxy-1,4-benzoquinol hydroxylase [Rubellimicrobium thermophilum DSM 16684]|uniref:2-octaprenyl-6-methoxyphenol hydroxylase/2-octaprenyl-3-methyl-6-methoxy-1, 4-benzoquinol hydroxylase n=1 Tax=Rubellimicrobium thermophilum DSM 16684 TaxID=1123069 RepID=S9QWI8_9RHOB|nr:UbiH/UbiF/VisC/COQ6 family ubiquinone biosynthesis hydroxylase [Rubellimicrobium thermophilum]EPX85756.1 2-octaprenyl-6-methoxyphenol hydroxylase/2-octaprenyl-3-methyl-6-methoxy-1,4-benzoquinol hydroxylase [Rubellimicrobium thermophilum DSM 16684]
MSDPCSEPFDALIAGGGLVGPSLALALAREGFSVALIEPRPPGPPPDAFDGRAYALALASVRLLRAIGVWARVASRAQPILRILVADGRPGEPPSPLHLAFDTAEIEEGLMGHMVEDRDLRAALDAALAESGVTRLAGLIVAQEPGPAAIAATLADGRRLAGRVLLGCDGRDSPTARRAGIRRTERPYGQTAVVATVTHERPHRGTAHQLFLPGGPLAILPLPGTRSSIVWSERTARAEALMRMDDAAFLAALRPVFGDFLGAIGLEGPRHAFPLGLSLAHRFAAPRVALAGDAAHRLHPIAGQGLNAGLRDVAALAEVLAEARARGEDIGTEAVLERYARWRRFDTAALAFATDGFNRLFSNDIAPLRLVRDLGLAAVNRLPPLRRAFIREAAGLTGDLPRLMR